MNRLFARINVSDRDAVDFLQGQLTQDLRKLPGTGGLPAAWCNAKGRVIAIIRLCRTPEDGIGLIVPGGLVETLIARLTMFRLRARVGFEPAGDEWLAALARSQEDFRLLEAAGALPAPGPLAAAGGGGLVAFDTGAAPRCIEIFGRSPAFAAAGLDPRESPDEVEWRRTLVTAGVPHIEAASAERYTPHMLNLDVLGAISFDKGCYPGQEVVARTEHLGRPKRRLLRYRAAAGGGAPGDRLRLGERDAGEVVNAAGAELLAIVPLDLRDRTLELHGHPAEPAGLPYDLP